MTDKAYAVPLHELLTKVPREARLVIDDTDSMGTRFIPVGRYCHEAAEALAQPEPAECDGGQCGIGGYCKECPKPLVKLKEMLEVQGRNGTWNFDPYFHGMYNGMEVMLAVLEGREPVFREAPTNWLSKKEWVGLTDAERELSAWSSSNFLKMAESIEAKLKEKNAND